MTLVKFVICVTCLWKEVQEGVRNRDLELWRQADTCRES